MRTKKRTYKILCCTRNNKIISLLMVMLIIITAYGSSAVVYGVSSEEQNKLEIILINGKTGMTVNGVAVPCRKPYISANLLYIPLRTVLETIGADVEYAADKTITVTYRDAAAQIMVDSKSFVLNQKKGSLPAPPVLLDDLVMIPLDFISLCFDAAATYDKETGKAVITLENDGALSDLSFLTGSITTPKAGNSYFGWSISLPRGSRVASQSFNSKEIMFENEHYNMSLEIIADQNNGKTLQQYYDQITEDPYSILDAELIDSFTRLDIEPPYIELLYTDSYEDAVYERIYAKGNSFFRAIVTSFDEVDPTLLRENKVIKTMLDSFSLLYKGDMSDTADFSKVSYGLASYSNYITSDTTGKKYLSWEMNVLPEWDLESGNSDSFITQFNGNPGEYIRIELSQAENKAGIEKIGKDMVSLYSRNFNSESYHLKSIGVEQTADYESYGIQLEVSSGSKNYGYDERLVLLNGLVYDITFKAPLDSFEKERENFEKMLDTLKLSLKDSDKILEDLQKYAFNLSKNRVGKDDTAVAYENKAYKWKLMIPGYWQKNGTPGQSVEGFYNNDAGAVIMVEASALKGNDASKPDQERFRSMNLSDITTQSPVKTYKEQANNRMITVYQYRIDDVDSDTFADVNYYIFDEGSYRYCFMTTIPDLTSSEFNLNSIKEIWNSFEVTN